MTRLRPDRLVVVVGTATEVGKTWLGAQVARTLRADGVTVAARKPAQSFDPEDATTDAAELAVATDDRPTAVCPPHRWYDVPMAPPMAAERLGRPGFSIADLVDELRWPDPTPDVGLVESAGGVRSPLADDGDSITLVEQLAPDLVVVVAHAGLGTINDVRLAVPALRDHRRDLGLAVFLNRFDRSDELHERNRVWLAEREDLPVATTVREISDRIRGPRVRESGS
jgi:dethiobiotin synthetase